MKPDEALTAYQSNRAETRHLALESSLLYEPVAELAREGFRGTVAELFSRLNCEYPWPPSPPPAANRRFSSVY
jgi:hypothetical protein